MAENKFEWKERMRLEKAKKKLGKQQFAMAERIKKSAIRWKGREASGKASKGFRPAVVEGRE